jgi:hypothetical protein
VLDGSCSADREPGRVITPQPPVRPAAEFRAGLLGKDPALFASWRSVVLDAIRVSPAGPVSAIRILSICFELIDVDHDQFGGAVHASEHDADLMSLGATADLGEV